ncbi:unnamed protein product [Staurois parvus]|uniref:Uncharacterized protein n=1 Tax=Staurois parvus TaxID=386267 RepID=A0ABN9DF87_9NEOB|nr:unnamed protein product [Staurois parvus]
MQRCIGIPCRAYLDLRSRDVPPAASPGHLLRPMPASGFRVSCPCERRDVRAPEPAGN